MLAPVVDQTPARTARRSPRSQEEIRRILLRTARERFAAHGYGGASTKGIADDAAVSERLIFSYFGSKEGLFEAAVLGPFEQFIEGWTEQWRQMPRSASFAAETRTYLTGLHELFSRHRLLVRAMISTTQAPGNHPADGRVAAAFSALLRPIEEVVADEIAERGMTRFNGPLLARAFLGMMMSIAALDHLFFTDPQTIPSQEEVVDQLTTLLVHGYEGFLD
jgi:AcrR family transcriptional regulator